MRTSPPPSADTFRLLQDTLGEEYALEREMSNTADARVFIAREKVLNRAVLITVLSAEFVGDLDFETFVTAAERTAGLDHPGIIPPIALGAAAGLPYIVTPYVPGVTLRTRMLEQPPLSLEEIVAVLRDVATALDYAHTHGCMHFSVTPEHILLSQQTARLSDFGIEHDVASSQNAVDGGSGLQLRSRDYLAPEQLDRISRVDHHADLFAWGCAAYEMLTGVAPFTRDAVASSSPTFVDDDPAPITLTRRDVPTTLVRLVMRALSRDPTNRPASAANIVQVLQTVDVSERALAERVLTPAYVPVVSRQPTGTQATQPAPMLRAAWTVRRAAPIVAGVSAVLALALFAFARDESKKEAPAIPPPARPAVIAGSVVVLPIVSTGSAVDSAYGAGLADEFARALARSGVMVLGRMTAVTLRASGLDPRTLAREVGAATVLTGTYTALRGDSIAVNLSLLSASNGGVRWRGRYVRHNTRMSGVSAGVAAGVVASIRGVAQLAATDTSNALPTVDAAAYTMTMRGRARMQSLSDAALADAATLFSQATTLDANFAEAYGALSLAAALTPVFGNAGPSQSFERASVAAGRAIALDSSLAEAYAALGFVSLGRSENRKAEMLFRRAIVLDSTLAMAWSGYALLATHVGDYAAARLRLQRAQRLEPTSLPIRALLAHAALGEGKLDEAEALTRSIVAADSTVCIALVIRADALIDLGRASDAVALLAPHVDRAGASVSELTAMLAYAAANAGQEARARELMLAMRDASGGVLPPFATIAATLVALGDVDSAVGVLRRAAERRDPSLVLFNQGGRFKAIRKDSRAAAVFEGVERW